MKVIRARAMGYCAGVRRAMENIGYYLHYYTGGAYHGKRHVLRYLFIPRGRATAGARRLPGHIARQVPLARKGLRLA